MATIVERIGKTGLPSYRVQIRHHSKFLKNMNANHTLGKTFRTKEEAQAWADEQEQAMKAMTAQVATGPKIIRLGERQVFGLLTDYTAPPMTYTSSLPFARIIDRYVAEVQIHKKLNTRLTQKNQIVYWKERLGTIPLNKLTTAQIVKEKDILFQQGKKSSTVRRYMVILNHMLNVATNQWELLQKNPCSAVKKPQDSKGRTRFLSQKEIKVVLEKCKASTHYQLYPIAVLALGTGARASIMASATPVCFCTTQKHLTIERTRRSRA